MKKLSPILCIVLFSVLVMGASLTSDPFPKQIPVSGLLAGTRDCAHVHAGGISVSKSLTLSGNGAQTDNLFTVTGAVRVLSIYFVVTEATDSTVLTLVKFETDDGAAQADITDTENFSGTVAGSIGYKTAVFATALDKLDATNGAVAEIAVNKVNYEYLMVQKTGGVTTYIRLSYTGDAATDVDVTVVVRYQPLLGGYSIDAV